MPSSSPPAPGRQRAERKWTIDRDGAIKLLEASRAAGVDALRDDQLDRAPRTRPTTTTCSASTCAQRPRPTARWWQRPGHGRSCGPGSSPTIQEPVTCVSTEPLRGEVPRETSRPFSPPSSTSRAAPAAGLRDHRRRADRSGGREARLMRVCLMIEGQEDVTWDEWLALAGACEETVSRAVPLRPLRVGLRACPSAGRWTPGPRRRARGRPPEAPARDPGLACHLPSPVRAGEAGRHRRPRLGWAGRARARRRLARGEHRAYGFDFHAGPRAHGSSSWRSSRTWTEETFSFEGRHYQVQEPASPCPKPVQRPRPTLLVGGAPGAAEEPAPGRPLGRRVQHRRLVPLEELLGARRRRLLARPGARPAGTRRRPGCR